jgi:soluble lytic murein transglycosylase-like protein
MLRSLVTIISALAVFLLTFFYSETQKNEGDLKNLSKIDSKSPPCLQMFYFIEKYSEKYNIPKRYAYGVAWKETGYEGPFHWDYNPAQESFAGAVGPMQVMSATADFIWKGKIIKTQLKNDIDLNVETSMKLLRHLHDVYKDWKLVFGAYNTGRPMVNQYSLDVFNYNPEKF